MTDLGIFIVITILLTTIIMLWVQYLLLHKKYLKALSLLRRMVEFPYDFGPSAFVCSICDMDSNYGHADGCELAEELK